MNNIIKILGIGAFAIILSFIIGFGFGSEYKYSQVGANAYGAPDGSITSPIYVKLVTY